MTTSLKPDCVGCCDACGHHGPLVFASYGDPQLDNEHYAFCLSDEECVARRERYLTANPHAVSQQGPDDPF